MVEIDTENAEVQGAWLADGDGVDNFDGIDSGHAVVLEMGGDGIARPVRLKLAHEIVAGTGKGIDLQLMGGCIVEHNGDTGPVGLFLFGEIGVVGETAILSDGEFLPDEAGLYLQTGIRREIVGCGVEVVVFGTGVGVDTIGTHQVIVERHIPAGLDVLCVRHMYLIVLVQRRLVGKERIGCGSLIEADGLFSFVIAFAVGSLQSVVKSVGEGRV